MHLICLQHVDFEGPGYIKKWAADYGHSFEILKVTETIPFPAQDSFDALIIMGGPMSVHDADPWLKAEKVFIKETILAGKKIVGICLGGQLLAEALGGTVNKQAQKEIGWFPVMLTEEAKTHPLFSFLPERFTAFHWHGETFSLPPHAIPLLKSSACPNQAFLYDDRVLAFQCHLELTDGGLRELVAACGRELTVSATVQHPDDMVKADIPYYSNLHAGLRGILTRLFA